MNVLIFLIAYVLGSIPFPYLLAKFKTGRDIREMGSGNVGATNVIRSAGKAAGLITLFLDVAKGAAAVLLGQHFGEGATAGPIAGFFAMLGHAYPAFLGFRGGKSVATGAGAFLVLCAPAIATSIVLFIILVYTVRIVSISSMIASSLFPLFAWLYGTNNETVIWGSICAGLIVFRHRPNIVRLIRGEEKKIGAATDKHR